MPSALRLRSSFTLLLFIGACATGNELDTLSGGTGSLTGSSSAASSSSGDASSSSGGAGGTGGTAGAGGTVATGGSGGTNTGGMGGAGSGGSSSSSSSSGMGGTGGAGGMGGGGGAGGGPTGTLVALAGPSAGGAYFEVGAGWTNQSLNFNFGPAEIAPRMAGGALAVIRAPVANSELFWTKWTKASGFSTPVPVGMFGIAKDGPATAPAGIASVMTYLGDNNKHYYAQNDDGNTFGAFASIPASDGMTEAFGPSASTLAADGVGVYAVYAGSNSQLYYSHKPSAGGAWEASIQVPTSMVNNTIRPFAFVDSAMDLRIFYVRQTDKQICMVKLVTPQNSWTTEETMASATTSKQPSAIEVSPSGDIVVVYHGLLTEGIYFVRGKDGAFTNISTVEVPTGTSSNPVIVKGLSGADAEILYATGGKLRHARVNGATASPTDVPNLTGVTTVAATVVP